MKLRRLAAALSTAALALPPLAAAQDAYIIGLTGALTGPPASTYAPAVDALRIYIDRLNAAGGINGRKVNLILQDDSAQPGKAAANAKAMPIHSQDLACSPNTTTAKGMVTSG